MAQPSSLLIRADANSEIGAGHVMRCLALAQALLEKDRRVFFAMSDPSAAIESRLREEKIEVIRLSVLPGTDEDAEKTVQAARKRECSWIVADSYKFNGRYQQTIKASGRRLLFFDDYVHADHYYADVVLNQNIYAEEKLYPNRESYTRLLLGNEYTLLRREFWPWRSWQREIPSGGKKILVTMGGGDPDNVTLKVISAIQSTGDETLETVIVAGANNIHSQELETACRKSSLPMRLERNIKDMPALMAWADIAITAGGITSWELAFMGLPSIVLILGEDQRMTVERLAQLGVVLNLGWHETVKTQAITQAVSELIPASQERARMSKLGKKLVDGEGASRVAAYVTN